MDDEKGMNGGSSDDRTVETPVDGIDQRIADLENKNAEIIRENKEDRKTIEDLRASVKELRAENDKLQKEVDTTDSDNKVLEVAVARTAELETEVSRLQQDFAAATSDLKHSTSELSILKRELEGMKSREKEKDQKLDAIENEKDLLSAKIEKMAGVESSLWDELQGKEKEIRALKKNIEEMEAVVASSKSSVASGKSMGMGKNDLQMLIEKMKGEISDLKRRLVEKEKLLKIKERTAVGGNNPGTAEVGGGKKTLISGDLEMYIEKMKGEISDLKTRLVEKEKLFEIKERAAVHVNNQGTAEVGGGKKTLILAAVAAIGVACCTHAVRKH